MLGRAFVEAGRTIHHLPLNPGNPRGEIALWTNDVDQAYTMLTAKEVRCLRESHNFEVNESLLAKFVVLASLSTFRKPREEIRFDL